MLEKFDTIIFDFDGVILNSMDIKGNGLRRVFSEYPKDKVEKLVAFHHENGGMSRYMKIRYFFEELLGEEITEESVVEYAERFSKQMRTELDNEAYLIEDAVNFIKKHHGNYHLHIASGADEKELQYICNRLKLTPYFKTIEGSPRVKEEIIDGILTSYQYDKKTTLLIGDSTNDYEAAKENRISFAGYNNEALKTYEDFYIESFQPLRIQHQEDPGKSPAGVKESRGEFTLRGITLEDEEAFQELIKILNDADDLGYGVDSRWYRKVLEDGEHIILVGYYLGDLVGVFTGMINTQDSRAMNLNVAIHPKVRRRGFGTKLYKEGIRRARGKNIEKLEAYGKNRIPGGVKFLEKQGFSVGLYSWEMEKQLQNSEQIAGKPQGVEKMVEVTKATPEREKAYQVLSQECFNDLSGAGALEEVLKDPSIGMWFLDTEKGEGEVAGGLAVQLKSNTKTAYFFDIGIRPKYRGKGMGLWMLQEVEQQLAARGYEKVSLLVAGENEKALRLYQKAGFRVKDEEIVFYRTLD
ncbi:GNAT family N-acetyltransferase [Isachenkonia alkalipeptolytica]|uniref:GNAT family N-acetyltransferase n=1 Tax=Isachenkonia alkalipeptolytica TaxID=2565777 RepID=A0AA44BEJ7_9CLOT|nr:GNAT family N-acetyltransferase [Isachenkonia alkalipeptolytica]NBG88275.1 GNAT family N-acetyltransferase [Isachenkonia alkalipeptolytica]